MLDHHPCPFSPSLQENASFEETIIGQKKKKKQKISFSFGGMISDKGYFGNLEQFDDVDKILPALPLEVAVVAPQEHVHHLPGYDLQILEGLDNAPAYWYHSTFALGGDSEPTFAKNHWMIDSGCTDHLTPFLNDFAHLSKEVHFASVAMEKWFLCMDLARLLFNNNHKDSVFNLSP